MTLFRVTDAHCVEWRMLMKGEMSRTIAYNMDCMIGMKQYPDKYFDLAVVDPPYGINIGAVVGGASHSDRKAKIGGEGLSRPKFTGDSMILESPKKNTSRN